MKSSINQFIRRDIAQMESYIPGTSAEDLVSSYKQDIKELTKLNANENPYGMSPVVQKALQELFANYYPRSDYPLLRQSLARYTKSKVENIIVGSGSDEIIDLVLRVVLEVEDKVIICPPTFGMYEISTKLNKGTIVFVARSDDYSLNISEILKECNDEKVKIVFITNPNSPTGNVTPQEEIVKILKTGKLVVVDEAYYEFSKTTATPLLNKYENLIIIRTFSKWAGLAGLRIGYAIAQKSFIDQILKIKPPFNVNIAAEKAALATLGDLSFAKNSIRKIITERERLYNELKLINDIRVYKGYGNFLFIQVRKEDYELLKKLFDKSKIALRYYQKLKNGIRITIGKPEQNNKVFVVLKKFFNKKKYAFLDRDGTIIFEPQDTFQIDSIEKLKILDGVIKGLKKLKKQGYEFIMISNQDGLGTASFPQADFDIPQNKMLRVFEENGITFNKIFICPHLPSKRCGCRKPKTGLVKKFLKENKIDKSNSFVCGDRLTDKLFAKNIGVTFFSMQTNGDFYKTLMQGGVVV
ncbi:MAG TPA: histidinol-phosphate transaminase [Candidatus Sulfotelmatobacter sp.]|jgi:histidinol-phosphate aminotransferase|nr:histidinol-phosphate transaminase [Candidatus Sulfotelmatobacter sp.]